MSSSMTWSGQQRADECFCVVKYYTTSLLECSEVVAGQLVVAVFVETVGRVASAPLSTVWRKAHARTCILRNLTLLAFRDVTTLCIE